MPKPPFIASRIVNPDGESWFSIADANDDAICTCHCEGNASFVLGCLNAEGVAGKTNSRRKSTKSERLAFVRTYCKLRSSVSIREMFMVMVSEGLFSKATWLRDVRRGLGRMVNQCGTRIVETTR